MPTYYFTVLCPKKINVFFFLSIYTLDCVYQEELEEEVDKIYNEKIPENVRSMYA